MEEDAEKLAFDQATNSVKMDSAEEITEVWVDTTGTAKRGWTKKDEEKTHQMPFTPAQGSGQ